MTHPSPPAGPITDDELARYREELPVTRSFTYLNHAGLSPTSRRVQEAVSAWTRNVAERGVVDVDAWRASAERVRALGARLLGCGPDEVAFVRNTSHGLALVAEGLPWRKGDRVAVARGVEYPSNIYPWQHLRDRGVDVVGIATKDGAVTADGVARAIDEHVRLVAVSSAQYASGAVTDLGAIGDVCRERGVLLCFDGIQTVGALPLDVRAAGVHFLSADSHKWMLGLSGIGLVFVDRSQISRLRPPAVGWKSTTEAWDFDKPHFELAPTAQRFEEGSLAFGLIDGFGAALELLLEVGVERIAARIALLVAHVGAALDALGCEVYPGPEHRRHVVTFTHPQVPSDQLLERLTAAKVVVSLRRGRIRVAPHFYNTTDELERLLDVVRARLG